jgi:hypothetical protein
VTRGGEGGRGRKLEVSSGRIVICKPVPWENEMVEGELGGHVARILSMMTAPKYEFKNLTSTHDLELSTLDIMIILKKSV